ncbi:innexin inx7 [Anopheles ziemanni]|uniref:innexin inx7 n=1 Tax=Anopheles coustani TaxID=139045 RepID=UPI00265A3658|nr:innexin inx7 [Anopheles coustani]XP_058169294.1 innexin inx7 [Anopheles ziemanni]
MLNTFSVLSPHLKFKYKLVTIDNLAFKFHYRATFIILLVCTLLVTSRQYIGEHIRCITGGSIPEHVINTFCFFTTTFTVIRHFNETLLQDGILPHPGVGPMYSEDPVKRHAYYQWVPFILFLQALTFYGPHLLWRRYEGGRLKNLVDGLHMAKLSEHYNAQANLAFGTKYTLLTRDNVDAKLKTVKREFFKHIQIQGHWARRYIVCEVLNLVNCIVQICFTNIFLGRQFWNLGPQFLAEDFSGKMDVLDTVFPKVTKCLFYKYGPTGSIQKHDALCIMALNVINEKIFTFLWFWYVVLFTVSVLALLWRVLTLIVHNRWVKFTAVILSLASPGRMNPRDVEIITYQLRFSEWLFLYYLAKNMDSHLFHKILREIADELRHPNGSGSLDVQGIDTVDGVKDAIEDDDDSDGDDGSGMGVKFRYEGERMKAPFPEKVVLARL